MLTQREKEKIAELSENITQTKKKLRMNVKMIEKIEKDNIRLEGELAKKKKEIKRIKNN